MTLQTFAYPKTRHIRKETPSQYKRYSSYRRFVEREFARQCVYCRSPDWLDPSVVFTIDHYLPKDYHRNLECAYSNLYYCCHACNSRKGTHPYVKDPRTKQLREVLSWIVPNPCDHVMIKHMRVRRGDYAVVASSHHGQKTIDLLDLNSDHRIMHRRRHEEDIKRLRHQLKSLSEREALLHAKMSNITKGSPELLRCVALMHGLSEMKTELKKNLAYLISGEVS